MSPIIMIPANLEVVKILVVKGLTTGITLRWLPIISVLMCREVFMGAMPILQGLILLMRDYIRIHLMTELRLGRFFVRKYMTRMALRLVQQQILLWVYQQTGHRYQYLWPIQLKEIGEDREWAIQMVMMPKLLLFGEPIPMVLMNIPPVISMEPCKAI